MATENQIHVSPLRHPFLFMAKKGKKGDKGLKSDFGIYKDEESRRKAMDEMRKKSLVLSFLYRKSKRLRKRILVLII